MQTPASLEMRSGAKLSTVKDRRVLPVNAKPVELVPIQPIQVLYVESLNESNEGAVVEYGNYRPAHTASPLKAATRLTGIPSPILRSGFQFARDPRDMLLPCLGSESQPAYLVPVDWRNRANGTTSIVPNPGRFVVR